MPWVHLDIAGPAFLGSRRRLPPEGRYRVRRAHADRAGGHVRAAAPRWRVRPASGHRGKARPASRREHRAQGGDAKSTTRKAAGGARGRRRVGEVPLGCVRRSTRARRTRTGVRGEPGCRARALRRQRRHRAGPRQRVPPVEPRGETGDRRALGERGPEPPQRHAQLRPRVRQQEPRARAVVRAPLRRSPATSPTSARSTARPGKGQHANLVVGDDVGGLRGRPRSVGATRPRRRSPRRAARSAFPPTRRPSRPASIAPGPGDLVLVSPGVYHEEVTIATNGIVLRGVNRNTTILDGDFNASNGVKVLGADGVAIENLTTRNYTENGLFWNGVLGYRVSYVTAYRNGDYGILRVRLAMGRVRALVRVGEPRLRLLHRPVRSVPRGHHRRDRRVQPTGYSGTNASGDLFIVRSVWRNNRTGIVPNSLDSEALAPQGDAVIAGNLIEKNGSADAATGRRDLGHRLRRRHRAIIGGSDNQIIRNHLPSNAVIGIAIVPNPGSRWDRLDLSRDRQRGARATTSTGRAWPTSPPCSSPRTTATASPTTSTARSAPTDIEQVMPCEGAGVGDPNAGALPLGRFLDTSRTREGATTRARRSRRSSATWRTRRRPEAKPAGTPPAVDLDSITRPS